ncbi:MAG: hypothetical protein ABIQ04_00295 [Candidatus Saccharimonadales bacterium]
MKVYTIKMEKKYKFRKYFTRIFASLKNIRVKNAFSRNRSIDLSIQEGFALLEILGKY